MAKRRSFARELVETAILTIAIFLVVRVALQNFRVEGSSMEPNLHNGEYILVNKVDYMLTSPARGDVIVFQAVQAGQPDKDFIKRVIGLPGETVAVRNRAVYINGRRLREPYIKSLPTYPYPATRVPPNEYFVLGDNRNNSADSHMWGDLNRRYIIGKAWISYWPPSELRLFMSRLPIRLTVPWF